MQSKTEKVWKDHNKQIKGFILSKVKNEDEANDILQDVFMKIHLNLDKLENKERIEPWVYQIARNRINDHFRKNKFTIDTHELDLADETIEPKNNWRFAKCMASFIKHLPQKYNEALTFVEMNNLSQWQLADKLNISYSGAKSRVQRGRELLKQYFSKCCDVSTDKYGNIVSAKSNCTTCEV